MKSLIFLVLLIALSVQSILPGFGKAIQTAEAAPKITVRSKYPPPSTSGVQKCTDPSCSFHVIVGMDKSGSMRGEKWEKVKRLMTNISMLLEFQGNQFLTGYTFDHNAYSINFEYQFPQLWDSALNLPAQAGGGTSFAKAIDYAADMITQYKDRNTYYTIMTDGQSTYPADEVAKFLVAKKQVQDNGKVFVSSCFFVQTSTEAVPEQYKKLCDNILAVEIIQANVSVRSATGSASPPPASRVAVVKGKDLDTKIYDTFKANLIKAQSKVAFANLNAGI